MKKILFVLLVTLLFSCKDDDKKEDEYKSHTVLVYMGMDNNFSAQYNQIMYMLKENWKSSYDGNLLVFADVKGVGAQLMQVTTQNDETVVKTIQNYEMLNSADPNTITTVLQKVMNEYPSDTYGMVVLSHGSGFISASALSNPGGVSFSSISPQYIIVDETAKTYLNIDDFAAAIPQKMEYVLFDACFMGGVEVAYALKDKVNYILGSPCEVTVHTSYSTNYEGKAYGLIYNKMMDRLLKPNPDVVAVATDYYEYYKKYNFPAAIAVIKTEPLADFADYIAEKLKNVEVENEITVAEVQNFGGNKQLYFDFADYYNKLYPDDNTFATKLNACIAYKANTAQYFSQFGKTNFPISTFCGLTNYIEQSSFKAVNAEYQQTAWYKRIYGQE